MPNAMIERVEVDRDVEGAQEHPQRGRVEEPVERRPEHHPPQQLPIGEQLLQPLGDPSEHDRGAVLVHPQLAGDPPDGALRATLTLHQPEHEHRGDEHHDHAGQRGGSVDGVDAADRDRDEQRAPQDQVEHDGRAEADGGEREAGIGAGHARERHQAIAERRARRAAAGHDARQRTRAHLDPEEASQRQPLPGVAERRLHERRVAPQRDDLEAEAEHEQQRLDPTELAPRLAEAGQQREREVVENAEDEQQLQRQPEVAARLVHLPFERRQFTGRQTYVGGIAHGRGRQVGATTVRRRLPP